jgi:hypothetical protein
VGPRKAKKPPRKRAYIRPTLRSQKVFETTALACAKLEGQDMLCAMYRIFS